LIKCTFGPISGGGAKVLRAHLIFATPSLARFFAHLSSFALALSLEFFARRRPAPTTKAAEIARKCGLIYQAPDAPQLCKSKREHHREREIEAPPRHSSPRHKFFHSPSPAAKSPAVNNLCAAKISQNHCL